MKFSVAVLAFLILFGCGSKPSTEQTSNEKPTLDGACGYLTQTEVEEVLRRSLTETPAEIHEEYLGGKGCSYFSGKDGAGNAYFAYVTFPNRELFEKNKVDSESVPGVGDEAYQFNGPDAQQLWVRKGDHVVMVAIGDAPDTEGSKRLATLVLSRIQ